jgi:hypothetical protein
MADSDDSTCCHTDLAVTFTRRDEPDLELIFIAASGEAALMAAQRILNMHEALQAGDKLTVEKHRRPTLTQRGLA